MNVSRRDLLRGAAATLLTGASSMAVSPALAAPAGARAPAGPTPGAGAVSRAAFAGQVGTDFRLRLGPVQTATLRLDRIGDLAPPPGGAPRPAPGREGFALVFAGPVTPAVPQGTYGVEHARLGSFLLFLVPVGPRRAAPSYEAVVNRLWP